MFPLLALAFPELAAQFSYDSASPLDVEQKLLFERGGVKVFDITYASPKSGRVTGFLTVPAKPGKYPGLVFGHWGPGNRTEFLPEAQIYARAGAVCVMIDYPWTRPAPWHADADDVDEPEKAVALQIQAVVDLRRAVDLLAAHPAVDASRLGYIGHSYGAQFGGILSAVEKRLKAVVLMAGVPDESFLLAATQPGVVRWRERTGIDKIKAALVILRRTAAVEYVPHAASPLLFQFARHEVNYGAAQMERFANAAPASKEVLWYDTGHELNDPRALADRVRWIGRQLRIRRLTNRRLGSILSLDN
ncbi:MAG: hypothetical protein R2729_10185 [Bryobacteraceae bacterium]